MVLIYTALLYFLHLPGKGHISPAALFPVYIGLWDCKLDIHCCFA